jgi:hypothetical protein
MRKTSKPKVFLEFKGMRIVCMTNEATAPDDEEHAEF